jgi:hypothetical protein
LFEAIKSFIKLADKVLIIFSFSIARRLLDINLFINQIIQKNYLDIYLLNFLIINNNKGEKSLIVYRFDYNNKYITIIDIFNLLITPNYLLRFVATQLVISIEFQPIDLFA